MQIVRLSHINVSQMALIVLNLKFVKKQQMSYHAKVIKNAYTIKIF